MVKDLELSYVLTLDLSTRYIDAAGELSLDHSNCDEWHAELAPKHGRTQTIAYLEN